MPPVLSSRLVIPENFSHVTVLMNSPASTHPPSFGFGVDSEDTDLVGGAVGVWLGTATTGFLANLHAAYSVERVIVRTATNGTGEGQIQQPGGLVGDDLLTPAVAALVKLVTATAGRRGRGRMYWPGVLGDGDVDNAGYIDLDARYDELQACVDELVTQLDGESLTMCVLHSYSWPYGDADPGPPGGFPAPSPVTGATVQRVVATQRRRQR